MGDQAERTHKNWQIASLLGFVLLIVVAAAGFGVSAVTAGIGFGATILGILNALLSPQASGSGSQNWFLSRAKSILNVSPYLKGLTIVTWLSVLSLGSYELLAAYRNSQLVTIDGFVQTSAGDPADGAIVLLKGLDKEMLPLIAKDGKFEFSEVDQRLASSGRATIEASWNGLKTHSEVDLSGGATSIRLKLPPGKLPLRVTYRDLEPWEIGYIIQGKVSPGFEQKLGNQPFVVPNRVFTSVRSLFKDVDYDDQQSWFARDLSQTEFNRIVKNLNTWNLAFGDYGLTWWKPVGHQEIGQFEVEGKNILYRKIEEHIPADFGIVLLDAFSCGSDEDDNHVELPGLQMYLREPKLRVAVLENVSSSPVNLGKFLIKENNTRGFRRPQSDVELFKKLPAVERRWFSLGILRPTEEILIPHSLRFTVPEVERIDTDLERREEIANIISSSPSKNYEEAFIEAIVHFDRDGLVNQLRSSPLVSDMEGYIFDASMSLDGLAVDGILYPLEENASQTPEGESYVMLGGDDVSGSEADLPATSCPFIYTYAREQGNWLKEGPVLYGLNEKRKEASGRIPLRQFDGRIIISEEELETSFIDFMVVKATLPSGEERNLDPRNELLLSKDGRYLKLEYGEKMEVTYESSNFSAGTTYVLVASGYYVPYRNLHGRRKSPKK